MVDWWHMAKPYEHTAIMSQITQIVLSQVAEEDMRVISLFGRIENLGAGWTEGLPTFTVMG